MTRGYGFNNPEKPKALRDEEIGLVVPKDASIIPKNQRLCGRLYWNVSQALPLQ